VSSVSAFDWAVGAVSIAGGFIGSVSGFGIGSLVTPMLATELGTRTAVAAVSLPHAIGTAVRFWTLRHNVNRRLLWSFGLTSAIGGLVGALLQAGVAGVTGWARRMRFGRRGSWVAGALSGLFGGLVGNQGGIRSAAMLGIELDLPPHEFVATATAVALFVDSARVPVYLITEWPELRQSSNWIAVSTLGVVIGTVLGLATLRSIPEARFRRLVSLLILALGVYMFTRV
jgi:uncharacterized membrane protein YfcA